jgi:hypothetical protein
MHAHTFYIGHQGQHVVFFSHHADVRAHHLTQQVSAVGMCFETVFVAGITESLAEAVVS